MITISDIRAAEKRCSDVTVRTPLLRLGGRQSADIWIKPEVLQPIGSFKLRGAFNAIQKRVEQHAISEVMTISAGNMSQAVAWSARRLGLRSMAIMPDSAPETKVNATRAHGAEIEFIPRNQVMQAMIDGRYDDHPGFIHPFANPDVAAGNGTIGLEILADLPDVNTVIVPVGGGGLLLGIAVAVRSLRPNARVVAVQPEAAPGFVESWHAGEPRSVQMQPTITDGAGSPFAFEGFFSTLKELVSDAVLVSDDETKAAISMLASSNKLVAEGAGALAVAAALKIDPPKRGKTVCVVSGGSVDPSLLAQILAGD